LTLATITPNLLDLIDIFDVDFLEVGYIRKKLLKNISRRKLLK